MEAAEAALAGMLAEATEAEAAARDKANYEAIKAAEKELKAAMPLPFQQAHAG